MNQQPTLSSVSKKQAHFLSLLGIVFILLVTFSLGADGLNADVIWFDELTSIGHAGGLTGSFSPIEIMQSIAERSPKHSPLFFEMLAGWGAVVSWHHATLRALSLFFGVLTIAWIYRIGKDFVSWRVGLWSALILGTNVFWIEYYHEIRMYTLQILLTTMMVWHYLYLLDERRRAKWFHWVGLVLSAVLSLYTQPFSFFVHVAIGIYHVLFASKGRRWFNIVFAFLMSGLLYLPWLPVTYTGVTTRFDTGGDAMPFEQAIRVCVQLFSNNAWLILLIPMGVAIWKLRDRQIRQSTRSIWILAILILLLLLVTNETVGLIPSRRARYFFVSWGLWSVVIGIGLAQIRRQWIAFVLVVGFIVSGLIFRTEDAYLRYQGTVFAVEAYPPMHEYVAALDGKIRPYDYVLGFTEANFVNSRGKHGKTTADYYMEVQLGIDGAFIPTYFRGEDLQSDMSEKINQHPYILWTYNPSDMPENFDDALNIIEQNYIACDVIIDQAELFVQRYVQQPLTCDHLYDPIVYDNGVRIVDMFAEYDADLDVVRVVTGWEVDDEQLLYEYNVSIQLVTGDWQNVGQTDRHLHDDLLPWYVAELPTDTLESDDYRVMVIVYHRDTGEKVTGTHLLTGETGMILPISVITVKE